MQLTQHPERDFCQYLIGGITGGFRIGFHYGTNICQAAKHNMLSTTENPVVVEQYLRKECELGRVMGPLKVGSIPLHINRFGVIPKPHQPGKWRLIVDLSYPPGASVNDGIEPELSSLSYASVDDAMAIITKLGRGTKLTKLDLESAYRIVLVPPDDQHLLGMEWQGEWYVDTAFPFGLRSAPKIFNALADGLMWIMGHNGIEWAIHYLDDYLFLGSQQCDGALRLALSLHEILGVPVLREKVEGLATTLILGILLDTIAMELQLPQVKLERLKATIAKI